MCVTQKVNPLCLLHEFTGFHYLIRGMFAHTRFNGSQGAQAAMVRFKDFLYFVLGSSAMWQ
jgi:hypothetical protein